MTSESKDAHSTETGTAYRAGRGAEGADGTRRS